MAKRYNGKEKIQQSFQTAKRHLDRTKNQIVAEQKRWNQQVNEGLHQIDDIFARALGLQQAVPQLEAINGIQLTQKELNQVAYQMSLMSDESANQGSSGSRKERRAKEAKQRKLKKEMSPRAWKFFTLLMVLLLLLAACDNSVGVSNQPIDPAPTAEVLTTPTTEAQPSPAPPPPTEEPTEEPATEDQPIQEDTAEDPAQEETIEIEPTAAPTPEVDATRIPDDELIAAAQEVGVTLTPEAATQFQNTEKSNSERKVMYRMVGSNEEATVEIARSDADGNITYEIIPTPNASSVQEDPENDGVLLVMANTDLVFTIDTNVSGAVEATPTVTPEPEPTPTPQPEQLGPFSNEELMNDRFPMTWPVIPNADGGYFGTINGRQGEVEFVDMRVEWGEGQYDFLQAKLLSEFFYIDAEGNQQQVWLISGGLYQPNHPDGFYIFFGSRARPTRFDTDPGPYDGNVVKLMFLERYLKEEAQILSGSQEFDEGDWLGAITIMGSNQIAQENVDFSNSHNSDDVTYGSGFTREIWDAEDQRNFWQTGDPQYLPTLPDGRPFIPTLRVNFNEDNVAYDQRTQ